MNEKTKNPMTNYGTFPPSSQKLPEPAALIAPQAPSKLSENVIFLTLIFFWYAFNVMYNLDNKVALNMLPLPWIVSVFQLTLGVAFIFPLWMFKAWPVPSCHSYAIMVTSFVPQAIFHLCVHIGAVISMQLGAVSFTHIVKAAEPVTVALLSAMVLNTVHSWQTYMSLLPIITGVALASVKELSFTWISFTYAMISNFGSSGRAAFAKKVMANPENVGFHLTSGNQYALITILSILISIPLAIFVEGPIFQEVWEKATGTDSPYTANMIISKLVSSSIWYHAYNLVAFYCLQKVSPITHSVANTLKRVVIIVSSILFFKTPLAPLGALGSAIAILGTFLYSLAKTKYH